MFYDLHYLQRKISWGKKKKRCYLMYFWSNLMFLDECQTAIIDSYCTTSCIWLCNEEHNIIKVEHFINHWFKIIFWSNLDQNICRICTHFHHFWHFETHTMVIKCNMNRKEHLKNFDKHRPRDKPFNNLKLNALTSS